MTRRHLEDLKMKRRLFGLPAPCLRLLPGLLGPRRPFVSSRSCLLFLSFPWSLLSTSLSNLALLSLPNRPCPPCVAQPPDPFTPVAVGSFPLWASAPALWPEQHPGAGLGSRPTPRSLSTGPSPSNPDAHPLAPSRTVQDQRGLVCAPSLPWSPKKIFSPERRGCGPRGVWPYKCGDRGRRTRVEKKS